MVMKFVMKWRNILIYMHIYIFIYMRNSIASQRKQFRMFNHRHSLKVKIYNLNENILQNDIQ